MTRQELNGKTYSVEDYLKQRDLFPQHEIVLAGDFLLDLSIKDLETTYRNTIGTFYIHEEDDGVYDGQAIVIKKLWFMVKESI